MRAVIFVIISGLLASCASSLQRVQEVRETAPEWYEARKAEIQGDGYPNIGDVPRMTREAQPGQQLPLSKRETLEALALFEASPANRGAEETAEEMLAWAARTRLKVDVAIPPADFMNEAEAAALRAIFDDPRLDE
ncbi:MAG: hypothetical protein AAGF20_04450 [Pseudomonadota bacterium]